MFISELRLAKKRKNGAISRSWSETQVVRFALQAHHCVDHDKTRPVPQTAGPIDLARAITIFLVQFTSFTHPHVPPKRPARHLSLAIHSMCLVKEMPQANKL